MKAIVKDKAPRKIGEVKGVEIRVGEVVVKDHYDVEPCPCCGKIPTLLMNVMENRAVFDCDCSRMYSNFPVASKEGLETFVKIRNLQVQAYRLNLIEYITVIPL